LATDALGILPDVAMHAVGLPLQDAGLPHEGMANLRRHDALPPAIQQGRAEHGLHVADPGAGRGQCGIEALGAA
jgi:hypothetical protein